MGQVHAYLVARQRRVIWLSLREFDGSLAEMAAYLVRAMTAARLITQAHALTLRGASSSIRHLGAALIAALLDMQQELDDVPVLCLDDFHAVCGTPAEELLFFLLNEAGAACHWLVASRSVPRTPLARLRAQGQLAELNVADLRVSSQEMAAWLGRLLGSPVSQAVADYAALRTEGWPAGLQLLSMALRRSETLSSVPHFVGHQNEVAAYFHEEAFSQLPADMQGFLLRSAVLPQLTPELCAAVTGLPDSRQRLRQLERGGLFISALDQQHLCYRYHPLFAEFLVDLLHKQHPAWWAEAHRLASRWYAERGCFDDALEHAMKSGDASFGAELLDDCWDAINHHGHFSRLSCLADSLPDHVLDRFPRVQMWRALYMTVEGRLDDAGRLLERLGVRLATHQPQDEAQAQQLAEWLYTLTHRRMVLAVFRDDLAELERLCEALQREPPPLDHYLQGLTHMSMLVARRERYRLSECDALHASSRALMLDREHRSGRVWHSCTVGPLLMQRGRADAALTLYKQAVDDARHIAPGERGLDMVPMAQALAAEAMLEQLAMDEACRNFEQAHAGANSITLVDAAHALYLGRSRLACHVGDAVLAERMLDEGLVVALTRRHERLRWSVVHERIRQALARADLAGAQRVALGADLPRSEQALRPARDAHLQLETQALAWARLALASGQAAQALRLMRTWITFAQARGATGTEIRASLVAARAQHTSGDALGAQRMLAQVLALAEHGGLLFSLIQEAEPIRTLLAKALQQGEPAASACASRQRLLGALRLRPAPTPSLPERPTVPDELAPRNAAADGLSAREIDILRHLARGLIYKEIGDRLGLTEGSIKWYMQQIYDKLGVRRRLPAVEKGRLLGYI